MRLMLVIALALTACSPRAPEGRIIVVVSANVEWRAIKPLFADTAPGTTPYGETLSVEVGPRRDPVLFIHGGWGKISAAGSAQYVIDRWHPELIVNLGTCGGFAGAIERFATVLAERTLVYDIVERMGDAKEAIDAYATTIDLGWLGAGTPTPVVRTTLVSADQDLDPAQLAHLRDDYKAVAGDWESGAIAYVAQRNATRVLILRGVTDLVGDAGGEAYGKEQVYVDGSKRVMTDLVAALPAWLAHSSARH
ncbi:MAG: 5'-methylthioadenosine/S-adenosylhomocysteine nucleosidase [Deltaproteobacteria bacterium]|nr:MAG: 5'-methylthioadenosine/S-adenosylhomocysteine nucleosidase [Deltaproteobacteria bacterium]TMQ25639.1 MAG: 5'-methylthioadenosine/S-adenosylhomocysteine nucleosidase [Deltaproteobacteria bacterium]